MSKPLRILVAHNVPPTRNNGMSRIMGYIHDHLATQGHTIDYFCSNNVPPGLTGKVSRVWFPLLVYLHAASAARSGKPYDIVNVHEPSSAVIAALKATAGNPVVIITSHGLEHRAWDLAREELRLGRQGPGLRSRLIYPTTVLSQVEFGLRRSDHIFCLNYEDVEYLQRWLGRGRNATRIFPGAETLYADVARGRDYQRGTRLLFAATWRKNKGIEDLIPAFAALVQRWPDVTLTILGGGLPEASIRSQFPEQLRTRLRCIQSTCEADNAAAYAASDILVLPSLFEGTPLTLMESMMSGLPIVTTATCGMKDVVRHGTTGLLIPIRSPDKIVEAVDQLMESPALRARLGQAAQAEVLQKYTWKKVAEPVEAVYQDLCQRRKAAAACNRGTSAHRHPVQANGVARPSPTVAAAPPTLDEPLRILLVANITGWAWTGMGKWTLRISEGLSQRGHRPTLWFSSDFPRMQRLGRIAVLLFPLVLAVRLFRYRSQFDVVVIHEPIGLWYGLLRWLFPWLRLPPMVVMCHNVESKVFSELFRAAARGYASLSFGNRLRRSLFRLWQSDGSIRLADHVICLSTEDQRYLIRALARRPDQVSQQINGVDEVNRQEWSSRGSQRVLFVGGWLDVKGRQVLPAIWSRLRTRFPAARLTILGTGVPSEDVLADFPPSERAAVSVIPLLTNQSEMSQQFTSHEVYLMPSLSEGSPLAMLEAMAAGIPVVASRVGGIPDIIDHQVNGLLFDSMNAEACVQCISCLFADPREAARLGRAGQERARGLTWDLSAVSVAGAIEKAVVRCGHRKGPRRGTATSPLEQLRPCVAPTPVAPALIQEGSGDRHGPYHVREPGAGHLKNSSVMSEAIAGG